MELFLFLAKEISIASLINFISIVHHLISNTGTFRMYQQKSGASAMECMFIS
jgi:hypothetical protein